MEKVVTIARSLEFAMEGKNEKKNEFVNLLEFVNTSLVWLVIKSIRLGTHSTMRH